MFLGISGRNACKFEVGEAIAIFVLLFFSVVNAYASLLYGSVCLEILIFLLIQQHH